MPEGKDPADLLAGGDGASATAFREAIEKAEDLPVFHVHTLLDDADLDSPSGRDRALDEVVAVIAAMGDSITREELMREVADRLDADPGLVARRAAAATGRGGGAARAPARAPAESETEDPGSEEPAPAARPLSARERRELGLLAMCVRLPAEGSGVLERLTDEHFASPTAARARAWLRDHLEDPMTGLPREDEDLVAYVTQVVMRSEREPASAEAMELSFLELERAKVDDEIAAAERQRRPAPGRPAAPPRRAHRTDRPHAVLSLRPRPGGEFVGEHTFAFPSGGGGKMSAWNRDLGGLIGSRPLTAASRSVLEER